MSGKCHKALRTSDRKGEDVQSRSFAGPDHRYPGYFGEGADRGSGECGRGGGAGDDLKLPRRL